MRVFAATLILIGASIFASNSSYDQSWYDQSWYDQKLEGWYYFEDPTLTGNKDPQEKLTPQMAAQNGR